VKPKHAHNHCDSLKSLETSLPSTISSKWLWATALKHSDVFSILFYIHRNSRYINSSIRRYHIYCILHFGYNFLEDITTFPVSTKFRYTTSFFLKLLLQRHLSTIFYYRFSTFRLVLVLCVSLTSSISCNKTRKASHSNTDDNNNLTATNKEIESRVSGRRSAIDLENRFNQAGKREEKSAILKSGREIQKLRNAVDHGLRKLEELVDVKEPLLYQMGECFCLKNLLKIQNFRNIY